LRAEPVTVVNVEAATPVPSSPRRRVGHPHGHGAAWRHPESALVDVFAPWRIRYRPRGASAQGEPPRM